MLLCKVRLVGAWIKRKEVVNGAGRIKITESVFVGECMD